jgi:HSP20 family protein
MLSRFDPVGDFERLTSDLLGTLARTRATTTMPIDAYRHQDQWVVKVDLPGVDPSTIDLTVDRNVLRIQASRDWRPEEGDLVLAAERPRGAFARQLMLSDDIDTSAIRADYSDGVLTVTLPVAEAAKPKKVAISTSGGGKGTTVEAQATQHQTA